MNLNILKNKLAEKLELNLPGLESHLKFVPENRIDKNYIPTPEGAVKSSVLILLYPNSGNIYIPVIKRVKSKSIHSGQISLPGGHYEKYDRSIINNALREANEEIGLEKFDVEILGELTPLYIPVSNFTVFTVLGCIDYCPEFIPNKDEVEKILNIDIEEFKNPLITNETIHIRNTKVKAPFYNFKNVKVWGATAMILSEFADILKSVKI